MKTVSNTVISVGDKPSMSALKSLVRSLRDLEPHLHGDAIKMSYTLASGDRIPVKKFTIHSVTNRNVYWTWNSTLSHEIERGVIRSLPEPFILAVSKELERQKANVDMKKINAAKEALAGLSEHERKQLLESIDKPKIVRKTLKSIDNAKTRVVKSRENDRKDKKPTPAEIRKASKTTDEKVA